MTTVVYGPSSREERAARTEQVIAMTCSIIPRERQAEALRDLAKGAQGTDPHTDELDEIALFRAAAAIDRETIAQLEEQLAEAEQDAKNVREVSATVRAEDAQEIAGLRAEVDRLRGEGDDIEAELREVFGEHRADDSLISKVRTLITWHREEVDFIGQIEPLLGLDDDPGEIPGAIRKLIEERGELRAEVERLRGIAIEQASSAIRAWCGIERIARRLALDGADVDVILAKVEELVIAPHALAQARAKVQRLSGIEARAAKHAVAAATVIAGLMRRLGVDEFTIEGEELAAIDHVVDLDVKRGSRGDYARLRVHVEPRDAGPAQGGE